LAGWVTVTVRPPPVGGGELGMGWDAAPLRTVTVTPRPPVLPAASRTDAIQHPAAVGHTPRVPRDRHRDRSEAVCMVATVWPATLSV
jgi:hypothetical protein